MEIEQYWAQVKEVLGLRATAVPNVYYCQADRDTYNVKDPSTMTAEQRAEFIEKLKERMGIAWRN